MRGSSHLLLDTNVLINLDRNGAYMAEVLAPYAGKYVYCISFVTYGEFLGAEKLRYKQKAHKAISPFQLLSFTDVSERHFMRMARLLEFRKTRVSDMLIAATALTYRIPLLTTNIKDFQAIRGLKLFAYSQP